jgi:predicted MPP superfamily phosphohydrolase
MFTIALIILVLGAIGHVALWVEFVNRVHAFGIRRIWVDLLTLLCAALMCVIPPAIIVVLYGVVPLASPAYVDFMTTIAWCYLTVCAAFSIIEIVRRSVWKVQSGGRGALLSNHTSYVSMPKQPLTAPGIPTWLARIPGNQVLKLRVHEKELAIPRLATLADPIRIAQISDLHMCGRIAREYFECMVDEVNALQPDLVAITGDIVEYEKCLSWIPSTLARLRASNGVYYVLGNHDRKVDELQLNSALAEAGLQHLGGMYCEISVRGIPLILAGNEIPWFRPAANLHGCPAHDDAGLPLRIVLAHSPDQFHWAQDNDVDLLLAGHLHGGQVCMPFLGAICAPSHFGVRYASGIFTRGNTVMHVSRGTGSLTPVRYNCPPEIAVLKLRRSSTN